MEQQQGEERGVQAQKTWECRKSLRLENNYASYCWDEYEYLQQFPQTIMYFDEILINGIHFVFRVKHSKRTVENGQKPD